MGEVWKTMHELCFLPARQLTAVPLICCAALWVQLPTCSWQLSGPLHDPGARRRAPHVLSTPFPSGNPKCNGFGFWALTMRRLLHGKAGRLAGPSAALRCMRVVGPRPTMHSGMLKHVHAHKEVTSQKSFVQPS